MQVYAQKSRRVAEPAPRSAPEIAGAAQVGNQSMEALMTGAEAPTAETMGHKVDLPEAIRAKMESSFGADLSGVEVYESRAVAQVGAQAMTVGSHIGFAPGALDFTSQGGQALLGHEVSHVVSQARGQVTGSGFLQDHSLEARADREGAMAAAGESVYSGPVAPLSAASAAPAAGPMQASKAKTGPDDSRSYKTRYYDHKIGKWEGESTKAQSVMNSMAGVGYSDSSGPMQKQQARLAKAQGKKSSFLTKKEHYLNPNPNRYNVFGGDENGRVRMENEGDMNDVIELLGAGSGDSDPQNLFKLLF